MRIALINSPSLTSRPVSRSMAGGLGFDGHDSMLLPPLDLAIMAATLRQAGETVELIDADPLRLNAADVYARLADQGWDLLLATVSLPTLDHDAFFLEGLRQRYPSAKIFGKTLIRDHQVLNVLLERSRADLVIHGESDLTIADLAHGRSRAGTAWLEADSPGATPSFHFDEGAPVEDLDRLPFPARDLLPNERYNYPLLGTPVATLQTSRGCPYPCGYYCPYPLVEGVKWRSQTPERILAELKEVVEGQGITKIYFRDATFTLNQQRVARLCELILAAGWRLEWVCETRVDCLGDPLLEKMRASGCVGILVGVETGDEQVMRLREGKKGLTVPKLAHLREKTRQLGIRLHFLLIVGLPRETRESIVATYDLIQRYKPDTIGVTIITPYPGTPLYEEGLREGWIESRQWKDYGGHQVPMHTPNLTRADMVAGKRFLEEGFAILQRRQVGGHSQPLENMARQHYEELLRWAYQLEEPIAQFRQIVSVAAQSPAPRSPATALKTALPSSHKPHDPSALPMSVVIPTYNRRAILRKTLLAFASQTIAPDQFELIVVDDGSSDDTMALLKQFKAPFSLRIFSQRHQGANAARNLAIREASGEIVLITGDDMIPEPAFLESHLTFHQQHPSELDVMLGFIDWSPEITVTPFMRFIVSPEGGQQFSFHVVQDGKADFRLFYSSNLSLKRRLLLKQPTLFDTDFTYPAYDDTEFGYRLARQGMQLHYNPRAVTCHHHEITLQSFVQRQRKAGHMAAVLARKHPELDQTVLGIGNILPARQTYTEQHIDSFLAALAELEKPDQTALGQIRINGQGYDRFYSRTVLYPLYGRLLHSAYALGVCEATTGSAGSGVTLQSASIPKTFAASIIIPVFNKVELTQQCLTKLAEVTQGLDYEVIVVDNHSTDGTAEFLSRLGGDVQILRNQDNLGFAKACNQGAKAARGRYRVFLNNDTIPLEGWLTAMVQEVEQHPEVAVVGSKLLYEDGTIQHAGVAFSRVTFSPYHIYRGFPADSPAVNRRREFQCVTGACMLVRREAFESVGGFDEGYRNGFEDVDLCLKIREQGWRILYQPKSVVYHLESRTPGRKDHERENGRRLIERWAKKWWLPDEDEIYIHDGYAYRACSEDGMLHHRLEPLTDPVERKKWELVAEVQRLAKRQDWPAVKALVARASEWPDDEWVLRWGAQVCRWLDTPELTHGFWERMVRFTDASDAQLALARRAIERGNLDGADSHLSTLLSREPQHEEGWLLKGILAMQRQAFDAASLAFQKALDHGGDPRKARMGQGMAAAGLGQPERAWTAFSEVLDGNPDDAEAIYWLLRAGTVLERWEALAEHLKRFVSRNPADLGTRFALAGVLIRAHRYDDARQECERLRALDSAFEGLDELARTIAGKEASLASQHAK